MSTYWGLDASTRAVSLAVLTDTTASTYTITIDPGGVLRGADRCHTHLLKLSPWLKEHATIQPTVVTVETPAGHHVHHASYECLGVLLAVVRAEVQCPVVELTPPMWKSLAFGNGSADKDEIMQWARLAFAYQGALQDEADAIGIGAAGIYLQAREQRPAA